MSHVESAKNIVASVEYSGSSNGLIKQLKQDINSSKPVTATRARVCEIIPCIVKYDIVIMAKVFLLVVIATATSARHLTEVNRYLVQPLNPEFDASGHSDQIIQRRNIDHNSRTSTNAHHQQGRHSSYINQEPHQHNVPHYQNSNNFHHSNVMNQEGTNDNYYNENEYGIRTRANFPTPVEDLNDIAYTNVKSKKHYPIHADTQTNMQNHGHHSATVTQKINKSVPTYEESLKTNINPVNLNTRNTNVNNAEKTIITMSEVQTSRPIEIDSKDAQTPNTKEPNGNEEDTEGWIWGSGTKSSNTSVNDDDLDDRAAFVGDKCPTGYAKICGTCVEKH